MFEIHDEVLRMKRAVEEDGGDMTDEQEITLSELALEERTKIIATASWARELSGYVDQLKTVKKEITERLKIAFDQQGHVQDKTVGCRSTRKS